MHHELIAIDGHYTAALNRLNLFAGQDRPKPRATTHRERAIDAMLPGLTFGEYQLTSDGIAVVDLFGITTKNPTRGYGSSYVEVRQAVREAATDEDVRGVMLRIDSPGGMVAGCFDLAADVKLLAAKKPIHAHSEDTVLAAAYLVASQASHVSIGQTAIAGSIGVFTSVADSSETYRRAGLKVHQITTGPLKGAGEPGTEVTDEQLSEFRKHVEAIGGHFIKAVSTGRKLRGRRLDVVTTGGSWIGHHARARGLADAVMSFDEAMDHLRKQFK